MKTYLHIHHLDPGSEERIVISSLEKDGILSNYAIEGDTESGNSIRVYIGDFREGNIEDKILEVLSRISEETIKTLESMGLTASIRLVVLGGLSAFFSPKILSMAGAKGIDIYVFNQQNV